MDCSPNNRDAVKLDIYFIGSSVRVVGLGAYCMFVTLAESWRTSTIPINVV